MAQQNYNTNKKNKNYAKNLDRIEARACLMMVKKFV